MKKNAVIIGAGPAGLTAAYELLSRSKDYHVTVLEESDTFGGISRTVVHNGNRMDMGGHRFFSKVPEVNAWWEKMMPSQGAPSKDDILLGREPTLKQGGPDPEQEDRVMLRRHRLSRIFFNGKFFDYPISLKLQTFANMGLGTTIVVGFSYLKSALFKRPVRSLEDFYINRFGRKLYSMFFENYTENLWGRHPSQISPEWGAQRVKELSILSLLSNALGKVFHVKSRKVETSLIEEFSYPKLGPGQLWTVTADAIREMGGEILLNSHVCGLHQDASRHLTGVTYQHGDQFSTLDCDLVISSMPVKDLVAGLNDVPEDCRRIAAGLPYRDYVTVGVLVPGLNLKNETAIKTLGRYVPDDWVYVHDRSVRMGRLQIFNNWSPYLVSDPVNTVWVGLEYFCDEGDDFWSLDDEQIADLAIGEMIKIGLISSSEEVRDHHVERVKKAYPAYFDTYAEMDTLRQYLDSIGNLYCVGRNGQHRYNNLDHSMCTSFEAVSNILSGREDKSNIWSVNTEKEYHESK